MHQTWLWGAALLLVSGALSAAPAQDDLARQCPGMAPWIKAKQAQVAEQRKADAAIKPGQPALRVELLKRAAADEKARNAAIADGGKHPAAMQAVMAADGRNVPRIRQIVDTQGFPTLAQVGRDGVEAAWLLVQHADRDPALQQRVLDELKARPDHGGVGTQAYTALTDRVLVAQHKPQRYGTQFSPKDGELVPEVMEDPAHVDQRRAAVGLPPLADYACVLGVSYRMPMAH